MQAGGFPCLVTISRLCPFRRLCAVFGRGRGGGFCAAGGGSVRLPIFCRVEFKAFAEDAGAAHLAGGRLAHDADLGSLTWRCRPDRPPPPGVRPQVVEASPLPAGNLISLISRRFPGRLPITSLLNGHGTADPPWSQVAVAWKAGGGRVFWRSPAKAGRRRSVMSVGGAGRLGFGRVTGGGGAWWWWCWGLMRVRGGPGRGGGAR